MSQSSAAVFVLIPISCYLFFAGIFIQQAISNFLLRSYDQIRSVASLRRFALSSGALCLALLGTLLAPYFDAEASAARMWFHICWVVAPINGYYYCETLEVHLRSNASKVARFKRVYLALFVVAAVTFVYSMFTGEHIIFGDEPPQFMNIVGQHLGGAFGPNEVTLALTVVSTGAVLYGTYFFLGEVVRQKPVDRSLFTGVLLTAIALIVELFGFVFQWQYAFSLLPLANTIEVVRLTHLSMIEAGRQVEQSQVQLRRDKVQLKSHLASLAHDVRTPLASLKIGLGQLENDTINPTRSALLMSEVEYLHVVFSSLVTLFDLELSNIKPKAECVSVNDLVTRLMYRFTNLTNERDVALEFGVDHADMRVAIDENVVEQTLGNLVYNAIIHAEKHVSVAVFIEGDELIFRIMDDGEPPENLRMPALSDRRYRMRLERDVDGPGWGLSLAVAHALANLQRSLLVKKDSAQEMTVFEYRIRLEGGHNFESLDQPND